MLTECWVQGNRDVNLGDTTEPNPVPGNAMLDGPKRMTCQFNVPDDIVAGTTFVVTSRQDGRFAWCLCVQRLRSQVSGISDETARCGGHQNLDELYNVLQRCIIRCYQRGVHWMDYMDVIKFVHIREVTAEERAEFLP